MYENPSISARPKISETPRKMSEGAALELPGLTSFAAHRPARSHTLASRERESSVSPIARDFFFPQIFQIFSITRPPRERQNARRSTEGPPQAPLLAARVASCCYSSGAGCRTRGRAGQGTDGGVGRGGIVGAERAEREASLVVGVRILVHAFEAQVGVDALAAESVLPLILGRHLAGCTKAVVRDRSPVGTSTPAVGY